MSKLVMIFSIVALFCCERSFCVAPPTEEVCVAGGGCPAVGTAVHSRGGLAVSRKGNESAAAVMDEKAGYSRRANIPVKDGAGYSRDDFVNATRTETAVGKLQAGVR